MLRAKPLSKYELSKAHVKPGQNAYRIAMVDHQNEEVEMRSKRSKAMEKWKAENDDDVYDTRREYLDKQRKFIVLDPKNEILALDNLTNSRYEMEKLHGEAKAKVFKQEQAEYNMKMKMHEKRFDFNNLQYTYLETRLEMMHLTNVSLDESMRRIKPDWKGHEDLREEVKSLKEVIEIKNEMIAKKETKIKELSDTNKALMNDICGGLKEEMEQDNVNETKKRKTNSH